MKFQRIRKFIIFRFADVAIMLTLASMTGIVKAEISIIAIATAIVQNTLVDGVDYSAGAGEKICLAGGRPSYESNSLTKMGQRIFNARVNCYGRLSSCVRPALCDGRIHGFDGYPLLGLTDHAPEGGHIACRRHQLVAAWRDQNEFNTVSGVLLEVIATPPADGDRLGPFLADVVQCQEEQFEYSLIGWKRASGFGDFPQAHVH